MERIELDIEIGSDPIRGRISDASGQRAFAGWLELVRWIDSAMTPETDDRRRHPSREPRSHSSRR